MKDYFEEISWGRIELNSGSNAVFKLFEDWKDSTGQAFAYLVSHSQILIRFYKSSSRDSFFLFVKDCYEVKFKDNWKSTNLTIEEIEGEYGPEFIIKDGDNLYIRSGVKPSAFVETYP